MNKLTIPALLLGVVMIAGAFAFMPVQEASTVHTTGAASGATSTTTTGAFATAGNLVFNCSAASACVVQEIYINSDGTAASVLTTVILTNGGTGALTLATNLDDIVAVAATTINVVADTTGTQAAFFAPIVIPAGDSIAIAAADGANGNVTVVTVSSGALTVDFTDLA